MDHTELYLGLRFLMIGLTLACVLFPFVLDQTRLICD